MTKNKIKGLLFDFNGTLFFDSSFHIKAFKKYFTDHGKEEPSAEFITTNIFGRSNRRIYEENFNPYPTEEECALFCEEKEGLYRSYCLEAPSLMCYAPGVSEMLDYLKANGVPYCLATGSGMDNIEFYINNMGLDRWFDLDNIVYFDGSFKGKPEPDTYLLAAKKLGLDTCECAVFEDGTSGMIAANRAGVGAVVCVYEEALPDPIVAPAACDLVYHDFKDWKGILEKLGILR